MGHVGIDAAMVVVGAVLVDAILGEVPNALHPVVGMGWLTKRILGFRPAGSLGQFTWGVVLVLVVGATSAAGAWLLLLAIDAASDWAGTRLGSEWSRVLAIGAEAVLLSTLFAGRGLVVAGRRMRRALERSLEEGRAALSHLCSRDPGALTREELCGATVESLAENASDSFVAPLFWYVLATAFGGPGLVFAAIYRAANTLDAMVGYRGKYEYLGKCAARFDDLLNWIPARLTAFVLLVASAVCRLDVRRAWHVAWNEHRATESPNAGWPMALAAGALGVELTKQSCYVLGRGLNPPGVTTILACERLIGVGFVVFTLASAFVTGVTHG